MFSAIGISWDGQLTLRVKSIIISIKNAMIVVTSKIYMELYKLSLPNEIVNNFINYSMDGEEDICKN